MRYIKLSPIIYMLMLVLIMGSPLSRGAAAEHPFYPGEYWAEESIEYNSNVLKNFAASMINVEWEDVKRDESTLYATATIDFAADSLATFWLSALEILGQQENLASITWKNVGDSTGNWTITTYLSNYLTDDSTLMNITQSWDTTGQYLAKPVNDTLTTSISGLACKYIYFKVKGASGNDKAVEVKLAVSFRKN